MGSDSKRCRVSHLLRRASEIMPLSSNHTPSPLETAALWHTEPGFVWLDSSRAEQESLSILGRDPDLILEGAPGEWHRLEAELERRKRPTLEPGKPNGAAIGSVRFDGSFYFGFYDEPLLMRSTSCSESTPSDSISIEFLPEMERSEYLCMVERAQEYIAAGDIYQVCLAHRFRADFRDDPWPLYLALRQASPAPHAAYLRQGKETILSSSPECFLKMSGRHILTRPIKGTRPRMQTPTEDEQQAFELTTSPKEIAELVMITDLERNDLGLVCEFGSVRASQLLHLERYAQVFHLVSTVEGTLRAEISQVEALAACFPGGSISGAPKKRALEIIRELETTPRGLFTGAIGYFGYNGESQFNIAIRTIMIQQDEQGRGLAEFHVGAGITADSHPEREWEETLHKAAGILQAARGGRDS